MTIIRDIRTLLESDEKKYYEIVRIGNDFSSNYIKYESNDDKDKTLSIEEYLHRIRPYLSKIINDLKMSSNYTNETRTMHSKSDNRDYDW